MTAMYNRSPTDLLPFEPAPYEGLLGLFADEFVGPAANDATCTTMASCAGTDAATMSDLEWWACLLPQDSGVPDPTCHIHPGAGHPGPATAMKPDPGAFWPNYQLTAAKPELPALPVVPSSSGVCYATKRHMHTYVKCEVGATTTRQTSIQADACPDCRRGGGFQTDLEGRTTFNRARVPAALAPSMRRNRHTSRCTKHLQALRQRMKESLSSSREVGREYSMMRATLHHGYRGMDGMVLLAALPTLEWVRATAEMVTGPTRGTAEEGIAALAAHVRRHVMRTTGSVADAYPDLERDLAEVTGATWEGLAHLFCEESGHLYGDRPCRRSQCKKKRAAAKAAAAAQHRPRSRARRSRKTQRCAAAAAAARPTKRARAQE